jgi:hypothetical protein
MQPLQSQSLGYIYEQTQSMPVTTKSGPVLGAWWQATVLFLDT